MIRIEFTTKTKVKRLSFAEFKCEGIVTMDDGGSVRCNATLAQGRVEFDHALAAQLGGDASFENCRALCFVCHRLKYPSDAAKIAKAKRREASHVGADKPKGSIPSKPKAPRTERALAHGSPEIARRFK